MKGSHVVTASILLVLAVGILLVPAAASSEQSQIAKANAQIQQISGQCVSALKQAASQGQMDGIAHQCDTGITQVLAALEAQLGHSVPYTTSVVCVTNSKVDYAACFDPIHLGGSGG